MSLARKEKEISNIPRAGSKSTTKISESDLGDPNIACRTHYYNIYGYEMLVVATTNTILFNNNKTRHGAGFKASVTMVTL